MFRNFFETLILICFLFIFISIVLYCISDLRILGAVSIIIFIVHRWQSAFDKVLQSKSTPSWIKGSYLKLKKSSLIILNWLSSEKRIEVMKLILMFGRGLIAAAFGMFLVYQGYKSYGSLLSASFLILGVLLILVGGYFMANFKDDIE